MPRARVSADLALPPYRIKAPRRPHGSTVIAIVLALVLMPCALRGAVIPPDDMFFAPLSLVPAVYPVHPFSGDGIFTPWTATWTASDILARDPGRFDIIITGMHVLPVLVANPAPASEQGEYTGTELSAITVANYMTYYAQKPGIIISDPATDYVGDLTGNVLTLQSAATANYVARVTTLSSASPGGPSEPLDYIYSLYIGDFLGEDGGRNKQQATRKGNLPEKDLYVVSSGDPNDNGFCSNAEQTLREQGKPVATANTLQQAKDAIDAKSTELGRKITVTLIGHGRPGSIKIGTERINKQGDSNQSGFDFGRKISGDCMNVTFFSCETGAGEVGGTFLQNVANGCGGTAAAWKETVTAAASTNTRAGYFDVEAGAKKGSDTAIDCNVNGIPDAEDIQLNPLLDGNGNSVPDSCEQNYFEIEPNEGRPNATPAVGIVDGHSIGGVSMGSSTAPGPASADYFLVQPAPRPRGIYRHRLIINSPTPGHTGSIRGLSQSGGIINPGSDVAVQSSAATTNPPRFNQWYGFGRSEQIVYRVAGTNGTAASYQATMETVPVIPEDLGVFPFGNMTISAVGQGHTTDTDLWVYDGDCDAIRGYGNDDTSGLPSSTQSTLSRPFLEGTYYLALSLFNMANNMASPPDDNFLAGSVLDFPGPLADSSSAVNAVASFAIVDANGDTHQVPATRQGPYDVLWFKFTVAADSPPEPCLGDLDGDGFVAIGDLAILLGNFGLEATAEQGDLTGDGVVNLGDLTIMLSQFGSACL